MPNFSFIALANANVTTNAECRLLAGETGAVTSWTPYTGPEIWTRIVVWKVPLLLLLFSAARPPLSRWAQAYTLLHLISDPIGSLSSLLYTLASCEGEAFRLRSQLGQNHGTADHDRPQSTAWKLYTLLMVSYRECSDSIESSAFVQKAMFVLKAPLKYTLTSIRIILESKPQEFRAVRELFHDTAHSLAADRNTTFLPVAFAQVTFIQSFAFAFYNVARSAPISKQLPTGKNLSVEGNAIAFSALFLWLITAVYLSSVIGASQTEQSMPRLLTSLRKQLLLMGDKVPTEILELLPEQIVLPESQSTLHYDRLKELGTMIVPSRRTDSPSAEAPLVSPLSIVEPGATVPKAGANTPISEDLGWQLSQTSLNDVPRPGAQPLDTYTRIMYGGLYSSNSSNSQKRSAKLLHHTQLPAHTTWRIRLYAFVLVCTPVFISCMISGRVPPEGPDCRHIGELLTLVVLVLSWACGRTISSVVRDAKAQFWAKFVTELVAGGAVILTTMLTVVGILNRCDCFTMWGRREFANTIFPDVAAKLRRRFAHEWPALVGVGIAVQLGACAMVTWKYRTAARVYLQKDVQ